MAKKDEPPRMETDPDLKRRYEEALKLLRASPTRQAVMDHRYWPWKRRAEAFLAKLDGE